MTNGRFIQEFDQYRASDHIQPTIDSTDHATILSYVGARPLTLQGFTGELRPYAVFIPDTLRNAIALPGADSITDLRGYNTIVGDLTTGSISLLLDYAASII